MYFIGIIVFLAFMVFMTSLSSSIILFVDLPSLLVIVVLSFSIMLASGLLSDFFKGFKLMGRTVNIYSAIELKRIKRANKLAIRSILLSGIIGTVTGTMQLLANISDPNAVGPNLAVALITVFYSLVFISLILPMQAKVNTILDTME